MHVEGPKKFFAR